MGSNKEASRAAAAVRREDQASIAAHRFGLGEADLAVVGPDARAWLLQQIGPADPQPGIALATSADALRVHARSQANRRPAAPPASGASSAPVPMAASAPASSPAMLPGGNVPATDAFRDLTQADWRAHFGAAVTTSRPFTERLALFWANHFTVSIAKGPVRGMAGAFEREAIRPHVAGPFVKLLKAAATHAAMLRYLDNDRSAGPRSRVATLRARNRPAASDTPEVRMGLNENLAREVLELHTLGSASGAYTQADVTAFAAVLTGWRITLRPQELEHVAAGTPVAGFDPAWHEPGPKFLLGRPYATGPEGLMALLEDLAEHPATARFIAGKLARHFVADDPPEALVNRLSQAYLRTHGDLAAVYRELIEAPECWDIEPRKLKTPVEFAASAFRLLGGDAGLLARQADAGVATMGQRLQSAASPAGWPDTQGEWLGPDAVWKRIEWATRLAERVGRMVDARELARRSLGPRLREQTARQIAQASDGPQALALLLLAPEFQRR